MTDISVQSGSVQVEKRGWLTTRHGDEMTPGVTLDVAKFSQADHYPNGYIKSGCLLTRLSDGKYGPCKAEDTPAGFLFSSVSVVNGRGGVVKAVSNAMLVHGMVDAARLPYKGKDGGTTAALAAKLPLIYFENLS